MERTIGRRNVADRIAARAAPICFFFWSFWSRFLFFYISFVSLLGFVGFFPLRQRKNATRNFKKKKGNGWIYLIRQGNSEMSLSIRNIKTGLLSHSIDSPRSQSQDGRISSFYVFFFLNKESNISSALKCLTELRLRPFWRRRVWFCFALLRFFLFGFFGCAVCTAKPSADEIIKQNVNKSGTKAGRSVTTTAAVRVDGQTR